MSDLIERLWASDQASALTNEAARALEARDKTIAELVAAFSHLIEIAPETLSCGYRCSLEIEHMEEEAYSAALGNAKFLISKAQSKDKAE
jgi:hypothetical protein